LFNKPPVYTSANGGTAPVLVVAPMWCHYWRHIGAEIKNLSIEIHQLISFCMKPQRSASSKQQLQKIFFFIAGMILSAIITNVIDRFFPPEPVVVHTVIDSVKIVHEYKHRRAHTNADIRSR
jgi:hypothetical protein